MASRRKERERPAEDPKELMALREWAKRKFSKCAHGKLRASEQTFNTSSGKTWHSFWSAKVAVGCDQCGAEEHFNWSRNEHGAETFI